MCPADCLHFVIVLNYFFFHKQSGYKEAEWQEDQFRIPQQKENKGMRVLELKETFGYPRMKSHQQTQKAKNKSCV